MTDLTPILVDIVSTPRQNYCHCGEPMGPDDLFCIGCRCERWADKIQEDRQLQRDIYGEDV